jgi:hypothetical protein
VKVVVHRLGVLASVSMERTRVIGAQVGIGYAVGSFSIRGVGGE